MEDVNQLASKQDYPEFPQLARIIPRVLLSGKGREKRVSQTKVVWERLHCPQKMEEEAFMTQGLGMDLFLFIALGPRKSVSN
jgi:hypothetical protein